MRAICSKCFGELTANWIVENGKGLVQVVIEPCLRCIAERGKELAERREIAHNSGDAGVVLGGHTPDAGGEFELQV